LSCQLDSRRITPSKAHCRPCDTYNYTDDGDKYWYDC
jgi:hypothetical protein